VHALTICAAGIESAGIVVITGFLRTRARAIRAHIVLCARITVFTIETTMRVGIDARATTRITHIRSTRVTIAAISCVPRALTAHAAVIFGAEIIVITWHAINLWFKRTVPSNATCLCAIAEASSHLRTIGVIVAAGLSNNLTAVIQGVA